MVELQYIFVISFHSLSEVMVTFTTGNDIIFYFDGIFNNLKKYETSAVDLLLFEQKTSCVKPLSVVWLASTRHVNFHFLPLCESRANKFCFLYNTRCYLCGSQQEPHVSLQ